MNPLVPAWSDVLFSTALSLHVVLTILGLAALVRVRPAGRAALTTLVIVLVPIVGPALWLFAARARTHGPRASGEQIAPPPRA